VVALLLLLLLLFVLITCHAQLMCTCRCTYLSRLLVLLPLRPPLLLRLLSPRALKARTSRAPGTKGSFTLAVSHYLDLPDLERWLGEWREALLSEAGVNWDTEHGGAAILPVFIFDVPSTGAWMAVCCIVLAVSTRPSCWPCGVIGYVSVGGWGVAGSPAK
jgi:hypothetical protein